MAEGIAVCLSGGGFRSALFHLGAMRRLYELRLLHDVGLVSSVSGGSILSGFLASLVADRGVGESRAAFAAWLDALDWEAEVAAPFRAITSRDFRTVPIVANVLWNWFFPGPRVAALERRYRRRVSGRVLAELPHHPRFVLCATDLTFGVNWIFERERAGDYRAGYLTEAREWPIARAIASSSCFPPIFGPVPVRNRERYRGGRYDGADASRLRRKIRLTDGGVYDNLGLEPAWKDYPLVLVSDGGAPFEFSAGKMPVRMLMRYASVVMNQAASLRKRMFFDRLRAGSYRGTYWSLRSDDDGDTGYSPEIVERIADIRTDLDAFTHGEQKILENYGYYSASRSIAERVDPATIGDVPPTPPHPEWMDEAKARAALKTSHRRISLSRTLQVWRERV